jgi:hypothetical protein
LRGRLRLLHGWGNGLMLSAWCAGAEWPSWGFLSDPGEHGVILRGAILERPIFGKADFWREAKFFCAEVATATAAEWALPQGRIAAFPHGRTHGAHRIASGLKRRLARFPALTVGTECGKKLPKTG